MSLSLNNWITFKKLIYWKSISNSQNFNKKIIRIKWIDYYIPDVDGVTYTKGNQDVKHHSCKFLLS